MSSRKSIYGKVTKRLGKGTYGSVYLTDKDYAVKISCDPYTDEIYSSDMLREASMMTYFDHPNIMKPIDILNTQTGILSIKPGTHKTKGTAMILDKMDYDLEAYITSLKQNETYHFDIDLLKSFVYQIASGMLHYMNYNLYHADLKPGNLLIKGDTIKITDFGLCFLMSYCQSADRFCTLAYKPPEAAFADPNITPQIDIWSLGCIIYRMFTGQLLFSDDSLSDLRKEICTLLGFPSYNDYPHIYDLDSFVKYKNDHSEFIGDPVGLVNKLKEENFPDDLIDLLSKILVFNPEKRIRIEDILIHPFLNHTSEVKRLSPIESLQLRETPVYDIDEGLYDNAEKILDDFEQLQWIDYCYDHQELNYEQKHLMLSHIFMLLALLKDFKMPFTDRTIKGTIAIAGIVHSLYIDNSDKSCDKSCDKFLKKIVGIMLKKFNWKIFPTTIYEYYLAMKPKDFSLENHILVTNRIMEYYKTPERLKESPLSLAREALTF